MKATLLLGLLAASALALPVAAAHIVFAIPSEDQDGIVRCQVVWIGVPQLPPHGIGSLLPCIPPSHNAPATLPPPLLA